MNRIVFVLLVVLANVGMASAGPSDVEFTATMGTTITDGKSWEDPPWLSGSWLGIGYKNSSASRALMRFDLTQIKNDARVARVWVMLFHAQTVGSSYMSITAYRVTRDWSESIATWDSMADAHAETCDTTRISWRAGEQSPYYYWDITGLAQDWIDGTRPNYGIMLIGYEGPDDNYRRFNSQRHYEGYVPRLLIDWDTSVRRVYLPVVIKGILSNLKP